MQRCGAVPQQSILPGRSAGEPFTTSVMVAETVPLATISDFTGGI